MNQSGGITLSFNGGTLVRSSAPGSAQAGNIAPPKTSIFGTANTNTSAKSVDVFPVPRPKVRRAAQAADTGHEKTDTEYEKRELNELDVNAASLKKVLTAQKMRNHAQYAEEVRMKEINSQSVAFESMLSMAEAAREVPLTQSQLSMGYVSLDQYQAQAAPLYFIGPVEVGSISKQ